MIKDCNDCKAGYYAPRSITYVHFEKMPEEFFTGCGETNDNGKPEGCDNIHGFHIDSHGVIDSGNSLPMGQKLFLQTVVSIHEYSGGTATF